jgi:hypothetical protein
MEGEGMTELDWGFLGGVAVGVVVGVLIPTAAWMFSDYHSMSKLNAEITKKNEIEHFKFWCRQNFEGKK